MSQEQTARGVALPTPTFITPPDIASMDDAAIETILDHIRERRLNSVRVYEQAQALKQSLRDERDQAALTKQLAMFVKNLAALDKAMATLEDRVTKIRALRLSLGVE